MLSYETDYGFSYFELGSHPEIQGYQQRQARDFKELGNDIQFVRPLKETVHGTNVDLVFPVQNQKV